MKKLVMLLAVLALCMPAYGEILVYKVSGRAKGIDIDDQVMGTAKFRGYHVVDVNFNGEPNIEDDVLIVYGRDENGDKIGGGYGEAIADFMQVDIASFAWAVWLNLDDQVIGTVTGKARERNIGADDDEIVALRMKGHLLVDGVVPPTFHDSVGSGKISARLKRKWTRDYNEEGANVNDVVDEIIDYLIDKGYAFTL